MINPRLSWWGPKYLDTFKVVSYLCPTNLTADSTFNSSSHCPVNSLGDPVDLTCDNDLAYSSSEYTTVDQGIAQQQWHNN